jgi:hypothetical protein
MPSRLLPTVAALVAASLLGACATPPPPRDLSALRKAKPASVLVLPPVNDSPDVLATPSVWSQLSYPLAESGYYVLPVSLVDETLKTNGVQTAADAHQIAPAKLREIFGADAVLYVAVKRYGSVYRVINSEAVVTLEAKLIDLRSGELLWDGSATASSAEQGSGNQAGLIGLLVQAVVSQIIDSVSERSHPIAGIASQRLLSTGRANGLLPGPRAPVKAP